MLRWKRPLFVLVVLALLLAACSPEVVEVTRVVTETEEIVTETVTEELEFSAEAEPVSDAEEVVIAGYEATGSEQDGDQAPILPVQEKVSDGREQTAVLDPTAAPELRAEPVANVRQPLTAGEIDDNANWEAYQTYLASYTADNVIPLDVRQRFPIVVQDEAGRPILDAQLAIRVDEAVVARLQTHSDGTAVFYPAAYQSQAANYQVEATANNTSVTAPLVAEGTTLTLPTVSAGTAQLDITILLDATGSMGDEIAQLKVTIEDIANQTATLESQPDIRLALVAYRDLQDEFVTRSVDFTPSVAEFSIELGRIEANGGGDYSEALTEALTDTVTGLSWRTAPTVRLVFLVADAPPHVERTSYIEPMITAAERGIKIYSLASSGLDAQGEYIFRQLSQFTNGRFLFLTDPATGQPSTDISVSVESNNAYTIGELDDLIVAIIREELSHLP